MVYPDSDKIGVGERLPKGGRLPASCAADFGGDAEKADPEEMFVAAE